MRSRVKIPDKIFYAIIILIVIIVLLILWKKGNLNFIATAAGRVHKRITEFVYYTKDSFRSVKYVSSAKEGIQKLNHKNVMLQTENKLLIAENEKLRRLLDMKELKEFGKNVRTYANVIGANTDGFINYYVIDKGAEEGVLEGDGVIAFGKVFGRVVKLMKNSSRVQLITDVKSNISVRADRNKIVGIAVGKGNNMCVLNFIPKEEDLKVGDVMVTSGLGRSFPEGIPVGKITKVNKKTEGLSMKVEMKPFVNTFIVQEVMILKKN